MDQSFIKKTLALRGKEAGEKWLASIPSTITEFEKKWDLKVGKPFGLYINYVAAAKKSDGTEVVLKICFPNDPEFYTEVNALKVYDGQGSAKLLDVDLEKAVILLERCQPGTHLSELKNDDEATKIMAKIMQKIWKKTPENSKFTSLKQWTIALENYKGNLIPENLINKAKELRTELLDSMQEEYLLHADLHHENVLLSKRGWLSVDPEGVIGERAYELAAMLRNPYKKLLNLKNPNEVITKRIDLLSKILELDRERVIKWAFTQTVLSTIWNANSGGDRSASWIKIAQMLEKLI